MSYEAKILCDTISRRRHRLTTFEITFPRIVLAEYNTHRLLSRNSASSRAIPVSKMLERVKKNPFIPAKWPKNQKGMQPGGFLEGEAVHRAIETWLRHRDEAVAAVEELQDTDVHKQIANRLLEPYLWHTVISTATEMMNFFGLRKHSDAQEELRTIAEMMWDLYQNNVPGSRDDHEWHRPLIPDADQLVDLEETELNRISVGRCARVSYLTHDGVRDPSLDLGLTDRLLAGPHMSPFEHVARPMDDEELHNYRQLKKNYETGEWYAAGSWCGNFEGWVQYRKMIPGENIAPMRT